MVWRISKENYRRDPVGNQLRTEGQTLIGLALLDLQYVASDFKPDRVINQVLPSISILNQAERLVH